MAFKTKHSDKAAASEWELVKAAATCHECGRSAANDEIEQAVEEAPDYESFASIIARYIEHALDCNGATDEHE